MPIIDEKGRLFGRVNAIDAAVAAAVVALAPVAYAAYLLFKPAPVIVTSVEPARVAEGREARVKIAGEHLRPYLRAQFANEQLHSFLIQTPTSAEADVPKLPPGTYDLTLFDETSQVAQLKNALTVVSQEVLMPITVRLIGDFVDLDAASAKTVTAGLRLDTGAGPVDITSAGMPRQDSRRVVVGAGTRFVEVPLPGRLRVPASLRAVCTIDAAEERCKINGIVVAADQTITLGKGLAFKIQSVRPDGVGAAVDLTVQFIGRPELIDLIKVGDQDLDHPEAGRLTVTSVQRREALQAQTATHYTSAGVEQTITRNEQLVTVEATLRVLTDPPPTAMALDGVPLTVGGPFALQTARYIARGSIVRVAPVRSSNDNH